jgi:hypothetical protein
MWRYALAGYCKYCDEPLGAVKAGNFFISQDTTSVSSNIFYHRVS